MRIAVVSDIHGNLTAFEAVLADIRQLAPDLVLHGGDLSGCGSSPVEIIDRIRNLGWQGVMGNTDEMLIRPETIEDFAASSSAPPALWEAIREIASATRAALGEKRLAWLEELPHSQSREGVALVHATPQSCWRAPSGTAADTELQAIYASLGQPIVSYGHTHCPAIRSLSGPMKLLINSGSVGLPYDGDSRASYLLLDGAIPSIRRIEYSVEKELKALTTCGLPRAGWTANMLRTARPQLP